MRYTYYKAMLIHRLMDYLLRRSRFIGDRYYSLSHLTAKGAPSAPDTSKAFVSFHCALVFSQKIAAAVLPFFACWNKV
jgi:hypothetical protein